jgi:hypothetical protein
MAIPDLGETNVRRQLASIGLARWLDVNGYRQSEPAACIFFRAVPSKTIIPIKLSPPDQNLIER